MFVAIYRWRLHPELVQDFVANWQRMTVLGRHAGSGKSSLFRDQDGCWVAMARWFSCDARQRFFEQFEREDAELERQDAARRAIAETFPTHELESVLDLWSDISDEPGAEQGR